MVKLNPNIVRLKEEGAFTILARVATLRAAGQSVINLGIGQPDFAPPPHAIEAARCVLTDGPHGYTPALGLPVLRAAVAKDILRRTGAAVDMDQVVITPGGKPVIFQAAMVFGGEGRDILYPDPGFLPYSQASVASGAKAVPYPVTSAAKFGVRASDILERITSQTSLIILNSPGNPTGGVTPISEIEQLADGLEAWPDVMLLSDEIYSCQLYDSQHISALAVPKLRERTVILDGWSKSWSMTGWRLGYGVWPRNLSQTVSKLITADYSCINVAAQAGALAALTGSQTHAEAMMREFQARRTLVVDGLNAIKGVSCHLPGGAFYAFADVRETGWSSRALAHNLLEEGGVALCPGDDFGPNGAGFLRLSFAASTNDLTEALHRIEDYLTKTPPQM